MMQKAIRFPILFLACFLTLGTCAAQGSSQESRDLSRGLTLYVVPYAHLDTQWRWDYPTTIRDYLTKTMRINFDLLEKYPHYIFNFSGSNRYRMMKEYYPAEYEKVKRYIAAGRWFPSGSSVEENDVNSPSAESNIRQILYGKQYFRREFGKTSAEYMLPDCFGFPASLPSILAHTGIKGFSTQKLSASWQPAPKVGGPDSPEKTPEGIPFNVGLWEGPDGKSVIAALNPGSYSGSVTRDISKSPAPQPVAQPPAGMPAPMQRMRREEDWPARIQINGDLTGVYADYHYYGTGDTGGAPTESSVRLMEAILTRSKTILPPPRAFGPGPRQEEGPATGPEVQVGDGPVQVLQTTAEQMFLDIKPEQTAKFPRYKGDLELINHSAGSLTSQTYMKIWNRRNELLADAAEKASVMAEWLGGRSYPLQRLNDAWTLVLGGQFHDIIPGTSIAKAYEYSWNDEILAMNQFAGVLTGATEAVTSVMDTRGKGVSVVVYNPLNVAREDIVEASVTFPGSTPSAVRVVGPDGKAVPAQISQGKVLFLARVPSIGFAVYDLQPAASAPASPLKVTESSLENARYRLRLNSNGDVESIYDRSLQKELLTAPIRLAIKTDKPKQWPAWNMDWEDQIKAPRAYVQGPAKIRIVENGPARVAIEVARETEGSRFVQTIRLSARGAGDRVEFQQTMDWKTAGSNLKVSFPLTVSNTNATYNWDIGTIERPTAQERQFEVASHQWVDLTDRSGSFGVTILTDCKNASDKSDDHTLNLTLVRTPGTSGQYPDQASQDWGHHEFVYGLTGHARDFRQAQTDWQGQRLNQPLLAFESPKHAGTLGKVHSFLKLSSDRVRVLALKKAEQSEEVVVRLVELDGRSQGNVTLGFSAPVVAAREINGAEEAVGPATVNGGRLVTSFTAYQPRTFALKLASPSVKAVKPESKPIPLTYDRMVTSVDNAKQAPGFDSKGRSLSVEMFPAEIAFDGIRFSLAPADKPNALTARGQTISLPGGKAGRLYLLAAADGDQKATFQIDRQVVEINVQDWGGYIGQWDNRLWKTIPAPPPTAEELARIEARRAQFEAARRAAGETGALPPMPMMQRPKTVDVYDGLVPGFVKTSPVAWFASHRHTAEGDNDLYAYSYLYAYSIPLSAGARTLTLPDNDRIRLFALTVSDEDLPIRPVQPLYDTLER